jgi:hypothetical protein
MSVKKSLDDLVEFGAFPLSHIIVNAELCISCTFVLE